MTSPLTSPRESSNLEDDVFSDAISPEKTSEVKTRHIVIDESTKDINLMTLLDSGKENSITFEEINQELSISSVRSSPAFEQVYGISSCNDGGVQEYESKETMESRFKQGAFEMMFDNRRKPINVHVPNGVGNAKCSPRKGRGRGRGTLLLQQAGLLPPNFSTSVQY